MALAEAPSLGSYLRSLREARGGSLEDMARSTRVGIRHLEALEEDRLADLPSPVFVRGFIRAYCSFLHESPDEALGRYQTLAGEQAAAAVASAPPRPRAAWANSSVLVGLALLLVLGIGLIVINLTVKRTGGTSVAAQKTDPVVPAPNAPPVRQPAPPPAVAAPSPPQQPSAAAARPATPPSAPAAPAAAPTSDPATVASSPGAQRLLIKAVEPTWIRIQPDEERSTEETLPAGASREWSAERRFLLTVGNAGGVELTLNGKVLPPLGPKGMVIHRLELPQAPAAGS